MPDKIKPVRVQNDPADVGTPYMELWTLPNGTFWASFGDSLPNPDVNISALLTATVLAGTTREIIASLASRRNASIEAVFDEFYGSFQSIPKVINHLTGTREAFDKSSASDPIFRITNHEGEMMKVAIDYRRFDSPHEFGLIMGVAMIELSTHLGSLDTPNHNHIAMLVMTRYGGLLFDPEQPIEETLRLHKREMIALSNPN